LIVKVRCDRTCTLDRHPRLVLAGTRRKLRIMGSRYLPAGATERRTVRLTGAAAKALAKALRHRRRVSGTLVVSAQHGGRHAEGRCRSKLKR
jgi:hypothetical protein